MTSASPRFLLRTCGTIAPARNSLIGMTRNADTSHFAIRSRNWEGRIKMSTDLGPVEVLGAEAIGQPGQRRFRLFARSKRGSAIMWIEKEQLNDLSLKVDRFLAQLTQGQVLRTEAQAGGLQASMVNMPADFPASPDRDFQIAELRIGYDDRRSLFLLI